MARREQEDDHLPFPNGWFAVEWSHALREGDVKPIHYFGEDMVVFRTRSGRACVLDAFCPHLGAHLGHGGRVMAETVRCPFHGWQYDGATGECVHIPYCERIPARARVRPWSVQEKNGMVWVWRHAEGKPPEWDFPELPEIGHPDWTQPRVHEIEMEAHVQETHENNNDMMHFRFVHGVLDDAPTEISYSEDRRHYRIVSQTKNETPFGEFETRLVRDSWGLGLTAVRTEGIADAGLLLYSSTTPVDEGRVISRWLLTATRNWADLAGEEFMKGVIEGVKQDQPIWRHKVYRDAPVLCEKDVYLAEYRQWVRQFYSGRDQNG